jgi:hypothetical protein
MYMGGDSRPSFMVNPGVCSGVVQQGVGGTDPGMAAPGGRIGSGGGGARDLKRFCIEAAKDRIAGWENVRRIVWVTGSRLAPAVGALTVRPARGVLSVS